MIGWPYDQSDPGIMLWRAAIEGWQMPVRRHQRILELGCCESDWLERMHAWEPSLTLIGVDVRMSEPTPGTQRLIGDARNGLLLVPESYDWVVMLGALEHFGLGFYGDPVDADGDIHTMQNVVRWLKPGGSVYFDVPCNPEASVNHHFRTYAPADIAARLLVPGLREVARGYSLPEPQAGTWIPEPTERRTPYHYVAMWATKDS